MEDVVCEREVVSEVNRKLRDFVGLVRELELEAQARVVSDC